MSSEETRPTVRRTCGGYQGRPHNNKRIQKEVVEKIVEILGDDVWLYASSKKYSCWRLKDACKEMNRTGNYKIPYNTCYEWFKHWLKFGETRAETRQRMKDFNKKKGRRKLPRSSQFNDGDNRELERIINEKPQLYLDEIQREMRRTRGKRWHHMTIWNQLHHLGYSLKVAVFRAKQQNVIERSMYQDRLVKYLGDPKYAIFVDETHKSANASRRRRAWSKVGVTPVIDAKFEEDFRTRYTLIAACDINGFVVDACKIVERERSATDNDPDRGTVDSARFLEYVEECLCPCLGKYHLGEPRSVVIMDNASIHMSEEVRGLIESKGAVLIYTAPYSPDLNPIEFFFSVYKKALKRMAGDGGYDWSVAHLLALKEMTPQKAQNYFRKAKVPGCTKLLQDNDEKDILIAANMMFILTLLAYQHFLI